MYSGNGVWFYILSDYTILFYRLSYEPASKPHSNVGECLHMHYNMIYHSVTIRILSLLYWSADLHPSIIKSHWSSETNDLKIDTCHFLARRSALIG